jgi:hypothetical protein
MASIATRAARRATSKSSMSGAVASTIALAIRSIRSGVAAEPAVTIATKLFATLAQKRPKGCTPSPGERDLDRKSWCTGLLKQRGHVAQQGDQAGQGRGLGPHQELRRSIELAERFLILVVGSFCRLVVGFFE